LPAPRAVAGKALSGTFYESAGERKKPPRRRIPATSGGRRAARPRRLATVFNPGYTPEVAEKYPHVARLPGGVATGHPRRRERA
jgi:hypothetical protein